MMTAIRRLGSYPQQLQVRWGTIALFAILIAYANGFWLTVIQRVVGAIERNEAPFMRWLRDATIMLPIFVVVMLVAFTVARRLAARRPTRVIRISAVLLSVVLISSVVSLSAAIVSSLVDYRLQVQHLELMHSYGAKTQLDAVGSGQFESAVVPYQLYCDLRGTLIGASATKAVAGSAITRLEYATFSSHVRALLLDSLLVLLTNLVIVGVVILFRDDPLWAGKSAVSLVSREATSTVATGSVVA